MSDWLSGRTARIVGERGKLAKSLCRHGAELVDSGPADILVHVARQVVGHNAHEMTHAQWREALDEGLDQRFRFARDFAAELRVRRARGAILFVGGSQRNATSVHAAASGALGNLTKTLGVEWARDGIRVNTILTDSEGSTLGELAAYILSDYSAYVTGAVLGIQSGES